MSNAPQLKLLIPRERREGESRVAATPETVKRLVKEGLDVAVEAGAGAGAYFADDRYREAGARIVEDPSAGWEEADVVAKVSPLGDNEALGRPEAEAVRSGAVIIGLLAPFAQLDTVRRLAERRVTSLALELLPRITRAQPMDALSSQASIAGYKAVLLAADYLPKHFPLLMTAAGTIAPARVVVMGAGVAGLQAVATAKRLGAVVEVSDIRPAVKEQVESLGGKFIDLPLEEAGEGEGGYAKEMSADFLRRQREIVAERVAAADVVITTALVPGKKAPTLVTREMVERMRPGSVIVDLAVAQGGNCELSRADEEVEHAGVRVLAPSNLPASMPADASTVYARNVQALLVHLLDEGKLRIDPNDEILAGCLLTHEGEVVNRLVADLLKEVPA